MKVYGNYDKYPEKRIDGYEAFSGWEQISQKLNEVSGGKEKCVIVLDCYTEIDIKEVLDRLKLPKAKFINAESACISDADYQKLIGQFVTNDRVFGVMNTLTFDSVYDKDKTEKLKKQIEGEKGTVVLYGVGAAKVTTGDVLVYLDLARWEIQCRFAAGASNWKTDNSNAPKLAKFKQGFFVEWRMADRHKREILNKIDFLLDTNTKNDPKMVSGEGFRAGLEKCASEPFRLVPYFAPEVWGGQWMKEVCGLDKSAKNFAWAFDGVPEENSIFLKFGDVRIEIPSIDVVFYRPVKLLGNRVHARFGDNFPIRFDFLDTMGGQNLSLQVHPLTEYIQNVFGMNYTQDESYYILDCGDEAYVYLGLKDGIDKDVMFSELERANKGEIVFNADKYVNKFKADKHDHYLIPAGTVHCSCTDCMVLEISATSYIFTFKLWDWERLGLDGLPRPVHLEHGKKNIQWDRTTKWTNDNLVNRIKTLKECKEYKEEFTGLHERQFIETHRFTINSEAEFKTDGSVFMCNIVDGEGAIIKSVNGAFEPYEVHYAETFILPESIGGFTITPIGEKVTVIRANVR